MQIDMTSTKRSTVGELQPGDVFSWQGGILVRTTRPGTDRTFMCVNLYNGEVNSLHTDCEVALRYPYATVLVGDPSTC